MQYRGVAISSFFFIAVSLGLAQSDSAVQLPAKTLSTYVLGPGDQLTLQLTPEGEDVSGKPYRIDENGEFTLPMAGTVHAAGLTVNQLARLLTDRFQIYIRQPQVVVLVTEMRSQPVTIMGAVNTPGIHQLQGHKTLVEMLALAGGLRSDAGYRVKITRRSEWGTIPLPGTTVDSTGGFSVAEVRLQGLMEAADPSQNVAIMPEDVLTVPKAEMIYVIGDVKKSGGFVLGERKQISVLQALALAEGLDTAARTGDARVLRLNAATNSRTEIPVNLKKILAGQSADVTLQANDILFVPTSGAKRVGIRTLEAMLTAGAGLAVYRP
jgi:polysaccharide export outer membrane protein